MWRAAWSMDTKTSCGESKSTLYESRVSNSHYLRVFRDTLHAWTTQWQRAPESSLDPRNPNGPVTFTSTALLGLAYVRLGFGFELGSYRILRCRDPEQIANRLLQLPRLAPGPHLLPAVLHATHALSIPVKLGVNFVAQSHSFVWSIQHSLCGLEFAIFLSKWSFFIADCQTRRALGGKFPSLPEY